MQDLRSNVVGALREFSARRVLLKFRCWRKLRFGVRSRSCGVAQAEGAEGEEEHCNDIDARCVEFGREKLRMFEKVRAAVGFAKMLRAFAAMENTGQ
jgi:hypothetical protein